MKHIGAIAHELASQKPRVGLNLGLIEFYECPDPDYEYRVDEIATPLRLLWLATHISRKQWASIHTVRELIEVVAEHHRFELFESSP